MSDVHGATFRANVLACTARRATRHALDPEHRGVNVIKPRPALALGGLRGAGGARCIRRTVQTGVIRLATARAIEILPRRAGLCVAACFAHEVAGWRARAGEILAARTACCAREARYRIGRRVGVVIASRAEALRDGCAAGRCRFGKQRAVLAGVVGLAAARPCQKLVLSARGAGPARMARRCAIGSAGRLIEAR